MPRATTPKPADDPKVHPELVDVLAPVVALDVDEDQADAVEPAAPSPIHANQLCAFCGVHELHPTTTGYSCEHGTWDLTES